MTDPKHQLGRRVFRGIEANILSQLAVLAVNLAVTPVLVRGLGTAGYGLFLLMWTLQEYLLLFTLGTVAGTQKHAAEYWGTGERERLGSLLRAGLIFQTAAGLACGGAAYAGRDWIAGRLAGGGGEFAAAAPWVFGAVAAGTPAYFLFFYAASVLYGQQRMRTVNALMALHTVSVAVLAAILLGAGKGLPEIGAAYAFTQAGFAVAAFWLTRDAFFAGEGSCRKGDLAAYFRFSVKSLLAQLARTLTFHADRVFIGGCLPLTQLGYYGIAASIAQKFNSFCQSVSFTVFPMFTELHATGQEDRLRRFYLKATELFLYMTLPAGIMTMILSPQFFALWLGEDFREAGTWPVRLLVLGNVAFMSSSLAGAIASGKGAPETTGWLQMGKTALLLTLWAGAIPRWGILGAAGGFMAAEWIANPIFILYCHRRFLGLGLWEYATRACLKPCAYGLALALAGWKTHGLATSWPSFVVFGAAGLGAYYALGFRFLDPQAKAQLKGWLREKFAR